MVDIEDFSPNKQVTEDNIQTFKEIVRELFNNHDSTQTIGICKKNFTRMFHKLTNKYSKKYKIVVKKSNLVYVYTQMVKKNEIVYNDKFVKCLQKKPVRGQSGVQIATFMFPPKYVVNEGTKKEKVYEFTCLHNCFFCPEFPDFPRSYMPGEPAAERGKKENFTAIGQMNNIISRLIRNGHTPDKFEYIYEGGTLQEFDPEFLDIYFKESYYAANVYYDTEPKRKMFETIEEEIEFNNKESKIKVIGLCIETRPDTILSMVENTPNKFWLKFFRKVGVTRIQLGVTHTNNKLLKACNRGHTYECSVRATDILKINGFKVAHHYMPGLPYSTPEMDIEMFKIAYSSTKGRPHEIKIYPYSVVEYSTFKKQYDNNKFSLYSETNPDEYIRLMEYALEHCPEDIRCTRTIRDIPSTIIYGGNKCPNLRQVIENNLSKRGAECKDIRSREASRRDEYSLDESVYDIKQLNENDWFISCISKDRRCLFGFLRLRLNTNEIDIVTDGNYLSKIPYIDHNKDIVFTELNNLAVIEELHVYCKNGILVPVGEKINTASQHKGVGKTLLSIAESIAVNHGYLGIAVISGEGVRDYYENQGYIYSKESGRFMIKRFSFVWFYCILCIICVCLIYKFI